MVINDLSSEARSDSSLLELRKVNTILASIAVVLEAPRVVAGACLVIGSEGARTESSTGADGGGGGGLVVVLHGVVHGGDVVVAGGCGDESGSLEILAAGTVNALESRRKSIGVSPLSNGLTAGAEDGRVLVRQLCGFLLFHSGVVAVGCGDGEGGPRRLSIV